MRVDLDAKVLTADGEHAGSVQRAVVDPRTNEVTELVISTGALLGRDVLLPRAEIDRASRDGDTIQLRLTRDELDRLPDFVSANYVAPPVGWLPPGGYAFGAFGGFVWPATYADLAAAQPPPANAVEEPSIGKGAVVFDRNGDDLGVVDDVLFDGATGRLRGFVLRVGGAFRTLFGGGDTLELASGWVDRVGEGAVHLRVAKEEVERAAQRTS